MQYKETEKQQNLFKWLLQLHFTLVVSYGLGDGHTHTHTHRHRHRHTHTDTHTDTHTHTHTHTQSKEAKPVATVEWSCLPRQAGTPVH